MKTKEVINWRAFKDALLQNPLLDLQFQYAENRWIAPSYHITEIKQAPIVSVDCGGKMNNWTEVIIQLWEPQNQQQERAMKVRKALSIIDIVEKAIILNPQAIVKIEFGNAEFDTRQMYPNEFKFDEENLVIDLRPDTVQCKAIERGGNCGTNGEEEECCSPIATVKPILQLKNISEKSAVCCDPGSGCCAS